MRFIHAADIHFSARNPEPALMSLAKIAEVAREREVDLDHHRGRPVRRADQEQRMRTAMPRLLGCVWGELLDAAPVVSVQGTPSHDAPGCYEPIERIGDGSGRIGFITGPRKFAGEAIAALGIRTGSCGTSRPDT